jgi:hypothetical protein
VLNGWPLEIQERGVEEQLKPQTLGDIELLQLKLTEALEELRQRKDEIQKKEKTPKRGDKPNKPQGSEKE